MFLLKFIGYLILAIVALLLIAFLSCVIKAFYICNIAKNKRYSYKKVNMRSKK